MDNLEKFFRNKLNKTDASASDWNKPDPLVRDALLTSIMNTQQPKKSFKVSALTSILCVLILATSVYICYLHQENKVLSEIIQYQKSEIQKPTTIHSNIKNEPILNQSKTSNYILKSKNIPNGISDKKYKVVLEKGISLRNPVLKKSNVANNKTELESIIQQQQTIISKLERENSLLIDSLEIMSENVFAYDVKVIKEDNSSIPISLKKIEIKPLKAKSYDLPVLYKTVAFSKPHFIEKPQKPFEIGYQYGKKALQVPSTFELKESPTFIGKDKTEEIYINTHGVSLGYQLNNRWKIKTGLNFSNTEIYTVIPIESLYNSETEYLTNDGKTANNLNLEQTSTNLKSLQEVQLVFEENNHLDEGDKFELVVENHQEQRYFQIPLSIDYQIIDGNNFDWKLGFGVSWNNIRFGDHYQDFSFYKEDKEANVGIQQLFIDEKNNIPSLHFLSTYASVGTTYQFTENWSAHAAFIYNYNFSKAALELETWSKIDQALTVGLYYHF